jgi:holliday junction DNA helicase RuvA
MISHISGKVKSKKELSIVLDLDGLCYEVLIPPVIMRSIDKAKSSDGMITLVTFHYYQMEPSKAVPVLVGFLNEVEKEFFEQFIKVSGVGPKAACKALSLPFSVIAAAIDKGDAALLKTLPGIGDQKAREIIAKLQGKVGKYGLIQDKLDKDMPLGKDDIKEEALSVLLQLQYKKAEAMSMIDKALQRNSKAATCEEILNEVYKQRG